MAAKALIILGLLLVGAGLVGYYAPWTYTWFGRLPGDIRYEGRSSFIFIPLTSMILVSIILSLFLKLLRR